MKALSVLLLAAGLVASQAVAAAPMFRTLPNGLQVGVFPDARLPLVQIQVLVPAGTVQETSREHGAAPLVAWLITRGTTSRNRNELAGEIEGLGGTISSAATADYATLSAAFPATQFEEGLELVADVLTNPIFSDQEVTRSKGEALATLFQSRRLADVVAEEHLWAAVLKDHPASVPQLGSVETVAGLSRADLQRFHRECYRPNGSLLAITGNVDPDRVFAAVTDNFGTWKGVARASQPASPASPEGAQIRLVDQVGAEMAEIRIGFRAPGPGSPDVPALAVVNDLLGGSQTARISTGPGRAIGARSGLRLVKEGGVMVISATARNDSVAPAITRLRREITRFAKQPPTEAEVRASARTLARSFPLANESTASQAGQWLGARFHGLGDDYLEKYPQRVLAVSPAGVQEAAQKWLDVERAQVVVVGAAAALEAPLRSLGRVEVVPITAPPAPIEGSPAMRTSTPSAGEVARGKELVAQAVTAHGGMTKLRGVKDIVVESEVSLHAGDRVLGGTQRELKRDPWKLRLETIFPQISTVQGLNGRQGWIRVDVPADSTADEDSVGVAGLRTLFQTDPVHLLLAASSPGARVAYRGDDFIAEKPAHVVEVVPDGGTRSVLFFDSRSHRLVAIEENAGSAIAGPALRRIYGDLRPEQGIVWPHTEERLLDGERTIMLRIKSVRFNTGVSDDAFVKPGSRASRPRGR